VAKLTLDEEFNTLGTPWLPVYPWSQDGWPTNGSWLANPTLLPPDGNPISLSNGVLVLSDFARPADVPQAAIGGLDRIGGQVLTQNLFAQTYGYFEASIQMPAGHGEGGAFWLMPQDGSWPPEIDIAEVSGNTPNVLVNSLIDGSVTNPFVDSPVDLTQGFHTYAVDWEPTTITWYLDNKQVFQTATPSDLNKPMYIILSLNSGTSETPEGVADPSLVSRMKVDWVHVYDSKPSPAASEIVDLTNHVIDASPGATFIVDATRPDVTINGFDPHSNVIDFEGTPLDFPNLLGSSALDGSAMFDLGGTHVSLPGVTLDDLTWANFHINGASNPFP